MAIEGRGGDGAFGVTNLARRQLAEKLKIPFTYFERMRTELREDPGGDWEKLAQRAKAEQALAGRVEAMVSEWTKLSEGA